MLHMKELTVPDHAGSRPQAQRLVELLPDDLTGQTVVLDCSHVVVGTPSFFDEIVKQVLVLRTASELEIAEASPRSSQLLERAAENRGVGDRLTHSIVGPPQHS